MFGFFKKKKKAPIQKFTPALPLTWWIDDLTHRVCALADHPTLGIHTVPWPDCDKFYLAVDKTAYDKALKERDEALEVLRMVEDNSKMPHQHSDLQTRLYCLAERAREVLDKHGEKK